MCKTKQFKEDSFLNKSAEVTEHPQGKKNEPQPKTHTLPQKLNQNGPWA